MLETRARVIRIEGNHAIVESLAEGGCGSCDKVQGCGSSQKNLFPGERQFRVLHNGGIQSGSEVRVALAEGVLLRTALMVYALPLLLMLAGAVLADAAMSDAGEPSAATDIYAAVGALAGLVASLLLHKFLLGSRMAVKPVIVPETGMDPAVSE